MMKRLLNWLGWWEWTMVRDRYTRTVWAFSSKGDADYAAKHTIGPVASIHVVWIRVKP
jgi:hypothetical protein